MARARSRRALTALLAGVCVGSVPTMGHAAPQVTACRSDCGRISGEVVRAGDRVAIADATVLVVPAPTGARPGRARRGPKDLSEPAWLLEATTDERGEFSIDGVPPGLVRVVIVSAGHERYEHIETMAPDGEVRGKYFVRPSDVPYRTVVVADDVAEAPVARRPLGREEIATLPGAQGDPLRALQSLPGVGRTPGGLGALVLRGASPSANRVYVGPHAAPRAFHIMSLASIVPADALAGLDLVPSNFGPRWGNATGGLVLLEPRAGRRDGVHGFAEVDIAAAGAMVEGPVGRGSFLVGAQRGYTDVALGVAERIDPTLSFAKPSYYDYQAFLDMPLRGRGDVSVRIFGVGDRLKFESFDPDTGEDVVSSDFRTQFHRVDVVHRERAGRSELLLSPSFRFESAQIRTASNDHRRVRRDYVASLRAEVGRAVTSRFSWLAGTELELDPYQIVGENVSTLQPDGTFAFESTRAHGLEARMAVYTVGRLRLGSVALEPGARLSAFSVEEASGFAAGPRLAVGWRVFPRWRLHGAVGLYDQGIVRSRGQAAGLFTSTQPLGDGIIVLPPTIFTLFEPVARFDPVDLVVDQDLHASLGTSHELEGGITLGATGFWREDVGGPGTSRTYGLELLVRKHLTRRLYGWAAYTLMRSFVEVGPGFPGFSGRRFDSSFDQRHNLVLLASYALPRRWRIGGRFRIASGLPFTPIVGAVQTAPGSGGYDPIEGQPNSDRFPTFHQLDVRIDRRLVFRRSSLLLYLDVQNVYNAQNVEAWVYTPDYRTRAASLGLPIFPALGIRVDY